MILATFVMMLSARAAYEKFGIRKHVEMVDALQP